ncbi:hypothetical protein [Fibrobacter sp. UWCM]|uniref:hypothetical protein n=1 Tax=Fibrobacter sp. UWCM TaxID=1896208 RepID=UPI0011146F52|nr:hypothetical protein [Fibrobacter sp. UWCM]
MRKEIFFTIFFSLENLGILIALCIETEKEWVACLFVAIIIFVLAKLFGLATSLSGYLFWSSLGIPLSLLVFVVLPSIIRGSDELCNYTNVLMLSPSICVATWMEVFFNRIVHKKPLLFSWPFDNEN